MDGLQPAPTDLPPPNINSGARSFYEAGRVQPTRRLSFMRGLRSTAPSKARRDQSLRSVTIKATSSIEAGTMILDNLTFWKVFDCLWSRKTALQDSGDYVWPFLLAIPSGIPIRVNNQMWTVSPFEIRFKYVPCTRPDTPSALRQQVYHPSLLLHGTSSDSEGWEACGFVVVHGHVFETQQATVTCTLWLALPLCYTCGSVIPCWLALQSGDPDAYEPLLGPGAWTLHLRRCVRYESTSLLAQQTSEGEQTVTLVRLAAWWTYPGDGQNPYTRTLQGESRIPAEAVSSCSIATYSLSYTVDLSPPNGVGLTPQNNNVLLSIPVLVALEYAANSPRPVVYAPLSYETVAPPEPSQSQMPAYLHMYGRGANSITPLPPDPHLPSLAWMDENGSPNPGHEIGHSSDAGAVAELEAQLVALTALINNFTTTLNDNHAAVMARLDSFETSLPMRLANANVSSDHRLKGPDLVALVAPHPTSRDELLAFTVDQCQASAAAFNLPAIDLPHGGYKTQSILHPEHYLIACELNSADCS
ncbi:hypothetical protein R3P38DRAFT_3168199 [Favolaschia claudopus]|uniref:Uncharacterized protein n=1 Tax=Favolaschia claudopus TaxID=2862362 RepID=A0AAW0E769_9AGAR